MKKLPFRPTLIAAALPLAFSQIAQAGLGYGDATMANGSQQNIRTYFANSPAGDRQYVNNVPQGAYETQLTTAINGLFPAADPNLTSSGKALRKFVDPLVIPGAAPVTLSDGTAKEIPVAVATKWTNPEGKLTNDDYFEIGVVEYTEKFHSDLKKATTMRGYVQIDHEASNGRTALPGSQAVPLFYPDGTTPIMINGTDANGKLNGTQVQAKAVKAPHFLGPVIAATKDIPTRVKFLNLLPVGRAVVGAAVNDGTGIPKAQVSKRNGDLFLPVDPSLVGAGVGPDGLTMFTQNRAVVHLHGGDTPWISDGTPEQWITPAGEANAGDAASVAAEVIRNNGDATYVPNFTRGASAINVPDMNDPGPGAMTYYFANGQSARLLWYHDHTAGLTRLNVYAGEAAAYPLTDSVEQGLVQSATNTNGVLPPADRTIPLVIQDRTFVPDDIALQDAKWNTTAWGAPGDSWFPHVYETVQDPLQANNWNAVGRWHYGPYFWPVFPALYPMPSGEYGDATTTPEAWMDTAIVNGVAYPTMEVEPTTYRFRILNASNDRMMTFNMFVADSAQSHVDPVTGLTVTDTEVKMIPATAPISPNGFCPAGQTRPSFDANGVATCTPDTWQFDNRAGGLPDPSTVGPTLYQIASEGGFLPHVHPIEPTPMSYIIDKGRVNVLNVNTPALFMGPAERADVVVDFSAYAGKTLIVYNDSGAPVPAGDPRNDYFTDDGDQSPAGGAENTKAGFGPNTRTMMQIKVKAKTATTPVATPVDATLDTALVTAYGATQDKPVVGQSAYSAAFQSNSNCGTTTAAADCWNDLVNQAYGSIYVGSLKEPQFTFTPGVPGVWNSVSVTTAGSGYITAPAVTFTGTGTGAAAVATLKIDTINVTNNGSNYSLAPQVTIVANGGGGSGASAVATLGVKTGTASVTVSNAGTNSGYSALTPPAVTFSTPSPLMVNGTNVALPAQGTAIVNAQGRVTGINVTFPGKGYTSRPTVTIALPGTGTRALASVNLAAVGVFDVTLTSPDPANPGAAGGGGYGDLSQVAINFIGGNGTGAAASATGKVFDITMVNYGTGYTAAPTVTVAAPPAGVQALAQTDTAAGQVQGKMLVKTKAIQELFEPTYGRLNATLGVEVPFTSALTQTTIPLGYVDETTEKFADGETQIWKITHNGVDTHPVHFHLLNVQLINRVGWDGFIMPPEPNEVGWKETVKMNPLEDVIVAVRAKRTPLAGFGMPNSVRPMDPSQPMGSAFGFTQIDPNTGTPKPVVNAMRNFNWEYVWHCHILGHEENDFMRSVSFNGNETVSAIPTNLAVTQGTAAAGTVPVTVTWTDPTPWNGNSGLGLTPKERSDAGAEVGFRVERQKNGSTWEIVGTPTSFAYDADTTTDTVLTRTVNTLANATTFADSVPDATGGTLGTWGGTAPLASATPNSITLTWTALAGATSYDVYSGASLLGTVAGTSYTDSGLAPNTSRSYYVVAKGGADSYNYRVVAVTTKGEAASSAASVTIGSAATDTSGSVTISTLNQNLAAASWAATLPVDLGNWVGNNNAANSVQLNFTDNASGETGYLVEFSTNNGRAWTPVAAGSVAYTAPAGDTGVAKIIVTRALSSNATYLFRVTPVAGATTGLVSLNSTPMQLNPGTNPVSVALNAAVPANQRVLPGAVSGSLNLQGWSNVANNTYYSVQVRTPVGVTVSTVSVPGNVTSASVAGLAPNTSYTVRMRQVTPNGRTSNNWTTLGTGTTTP